MWKRKVNWKKQTYSKDLWVHAVNIGWMKSGESFQPALFSTKSKLCEFTGELGTDIDMELEFV